MAAKKAPIGLARAGKSLWTGITGKYELRADELRLLEDAAREADLIETLNDGLVGLPLMMKGSTGQDIVNPIYGELRQHRSALAGLLRALKLPDENPERAAVDRSSAARTAATARWAKRGG
jgi:hypothetical protein